MTTIKSYGSSFLKEMPQYRAYRKWFDEAPDGSRYIYFRGVSLTETNISFSLGKIILQDAYKGEVLLFQRRISRGLFLNAPPFEYIAVRKHRAPRKLVPNKLTVVEAA